MDPREEMKALEQEMFRQFKVASSYDETEPDCKSAVRARQMGEWLAELLAVRRSRLSMVLMIHEMGFPSVEDVVQIHEMLEDESEEEEGPSCLRCGSSRHLVWKEGGYQCGNCGATT